MRLMLCVAASLVLIAADALALDDTPIPSAYVLASAAGRMAPRVRPEPLSAPPAAAHPHAIRVGAKIRAGTRAKVRAHGATSPPAALAAAPKQLP